ncbi:hypothetical protein [Acaryochloris sp. CCMEE 5410]|uniref:hypothetical protein n=1 Tax=Acaryochloris sp. CCMEE 5410 TaxID=310037 RepID=UPI0021D09623|nr:hypothetical protein [Acaryochloris sp. CCMEE 5410]
METNEHNRTSTINNRTSTKSEANSVPHGRDHHPDQSVEEVQAQNQHILDENRELKSQVRERINTIPMEVKAVLNLFIQEFKEAMASKKPRI